MYLRKVGLIKNYYNKLFMDNVYPYPKSRNGLYLKKKKLIHRTFQVMYPIFNKNTSFFSLYCSLITHKNTKIKNNLNQSILFESYISNNKLFLNVPLSSLFILVK